MRPLGAPSPHVPNVRVPSHVSLFSRKFWASKVMYRGSAADFSVVFCTPTAAAAAVETAAGSPLLSLTSPPRPRFCAEDLLKPCWSTLRRRQPSTCHHAEESCLNVCSHLLWHLQWDSRVYTKPPKVGRRTSVHGLRSPNLPTNQRHTTMPSSYVWKMWRWGPERSHTSNC